MSDVEAVLLGIAQDAGIPQAGCTGTHCRRARSQPEHRQLVVSLGLIDHNSERYWLIDATPDFREQIYLLNQANLAYQFDGIILTHLHIGHYTGLVFIGPESMNLYDLNLYVSWRTEKFLRENQPWGLLIQRKHLVPQRITPGQLLHLSDHLVLQPVRVPHRDEFSDTLAFFVSGPDRTLFFCPDIDDWDRWDHDLREVVAGVDIALLDAPFFSHDELPKRDFSQIPHPLVTDTVRRLSGILQDVRLIHINHTNPLLVNGPERSWLRRQGFELGYTGQRWSL